MLQHIESPNDAYQDSVTLFLHQLSSADINDVYNRVSTILRKANGYMVECSPILS